MIDFQFVRLGDKNLFDKYLRQRRYEGSESNFTNFYMWNECYNIRWAVIEDFLCIKSNLEGVDFILPPYGLNDQDIEKPIDKPIDKLIEYFKENNMPFVMRAISPKMKEKLEAIYPGKFSFKETPEVYDYVYNAEDLINLAGRKYHRKRNHIKRFHKGYPDFKVVPLTKDLLDLCIINLKEWCLKNGCEEDENLLCERDAIISAFDAFEYLDYVGGVLLINDNIEAFTFGEALNEDTVVIHVEKANSDFNGIYPTINQEFLRNNWTQMKYVNREEDLGIEGLRKSKQSYYPVKMIEKYEAILTIEGSKNV